MDSKTKLKIIALNVNGLSHISKRQELSLFLEEHKPDVMMLSEIRINHKKRIHYKNYHALQNCRTNRLGGGTGLLINEKFKIHTIDTVNIAPLECTMAFMEQSNNTKILLASIYNNSCTNKNINEALNKILQIAGNNQLIIGGDFNAHHQLWSQNITNQDNAGKTIAKWLQDQAILNNFEVIPTVEPTFYRQETGTYIDFFITNVNHILFDQNYPNFAITHESFSDHRAIEIIISTNQPTLKEKYSILNFKKTNIPHFKSILDRESQDIQIPTNQNITNEEIEAFTLKITESIDRAVKNAVPVQEIKNQGTKQLPDNILQLIKKKNEMRRYYHNHRYNSTLPTNLLKSQINNLEKIIRDLINVFSIKSWQFQLKNIKKDNNTFKNIKKFSGHTQVNTLPNLKINNTIITDNKDKLNIIAQQFEQVHHQNMDLGNTFTENLINRVVADIPLRTHYQPFNNCNSALACNDNTRQFFTEADIINLINQRNNKKTAGFDNLPNFLLKKAPKNFFKIITILFNHCINNSYFPQLWKKAIIIPILKPKKPPDNPSSYRPISLLCCISKLFEVCILELINQHLDSHNILQDFQMGFRRNLSTYHALTTFASEVSDNLNHRRATVACFIDIEKAFDTVWINGLIYKMKFKFNFPDHITNLIKSYTYGRTFTVTNKNNQSSERDIVAGIPQGSILGPVLYNIYLADIPKPPDGVNIICYADDVVAYAAGVRLSNMCTSLNLYLETLTNYYTNWKTKINIDKCQCMSIYGKSNEAYRNVTKKKYLVVKLNNNLIKATNSFRYLGVTFDKTFCFNQHVNGLLHKAKAALAAYITIMRPKKSIASDLKLLCYKQLIRPIITYGFPIWHNISPYTMELIRMFERKCLRYCINKNKYLNYNNEIRTYANKMVYNTSKITRIDKFLVQTALKFISNLQSVDNNLIAQYITNKINQTNIMGQYKCPYNLKILENNNQLFNTNNEIIYYNQIINGSFQYNNEQFIED